MAISKCFLEPETVIKRIRHLDPAHNTLYNLQDDLATAKLFSDVFSDCELYNPQAKLFMTYDGVKWSIDTGNMITETNMKMFVRALDLYAQNGTDSTYQRYVEKLGARTDRKRIIEDARDFNHKTYDCFDQQPYLFNCQNCIIDLNTGAQLEHDPKLLLSKVSNVIYDPDATSELFEQFMSQIMLGNADKINYMQEILGYSLIGLNPREEFYIWYGRSTRNGKGTLSGTMLHLFGDYGRNISPESFAVRDRNSSGASSDLARLDGVRYLQCSEPKKKLNIDAAMLKSMTGGDVITARELYQLEREFTAIFKLHMNTNYLPLVNDPTLFSSDRVRVITFDKHFSEDERDQSLKEKLRQPETISGVFNWMLQGLKHYNEMDGTISIPAEVREAVAEYSRNSDKIGRFLEDCLYQEDGTNVTVKSCYDLFVTWCSQNGHHAESKSSFMESLKDRGLVSPRGTVRGVSCHNVILNHSIDTTCTI